MTTSADQIYQSLQAVAQLRQLRAGDAQLLAANSFIKRFQAQRFRATYPDLLGSPRYQAAAQFFLTELYGVKDYGERDQQFARIASTMVKLFPQSVVNTAAALTQAHALTEQLDDAMARAYLALICGANTAFSFGVKTAFDAAVKPGESVDSVVDTSDAARYIACWRVTGDKACRLQQLDIVLALGHSLNGLTRKPGLRTLLKMMRGPAVASNLGALQRFLESGFDAFQAMRGADDFLRLIADREAGWIDSLFNDDIVACETKLAQLLAKGGTV